MITALTARRGLVKLAAIPVITAGVTVTLAGSAAQATQAPRQRPAASHSAGRATNRVLPILASDLRVRVAASQHSAVSGKLGSAGSLVSVTCWATGTVYLNSPIWYQISVPLAGYLPAFYVAAHFAPAIGVRHCPSPLFRRQYAVLEPSLHIRSQASTGAQVTGFLPAIGSLISVDCYVTGTAIYGDPVWYHTVAPAAGYVTGRFLNTGHDPDTGVPPC